GPGPGPMVSTSPIQPPSQQQQNIQSAHRHIPDQIPIPLHEVVGREDMIHHQRMQEHHMCEQMMREQQQKLHQQDNDERLREQHIRYVEEQQMREQQLREQHQHPHPQLLPPHEQ